MLYTNGAAWVNGAHVPRTSSAIFSGDLLQTRSDSVANINQNWLKHHGFSRLTGTVSGRIRGT